MRIGDRADHGILDPLSGWPVLVANLDRECSPLAFDDRCIAHQCRHSFDIERCRHDEQAQVFPQPGPNIERQRQPEVRIERTLVELVEENGCHARKLGIIEDHPGEDALRDDLDHGFPRNARL